jgi:S1-C subfamily serine protease
MITPQHHSSRETTEIERDGDDELSARDPSERRDGGPFRDRGDTLRARRDTLRRELAEIEQQLGTETATTTSAQTPARPPWSPRAVLIATLAAAGLGLGASATIDHWLAAHDEATRSSVIVAPPITRSITVTPDPREPERASTVQIAQVPPSFFASIPTWSERFEGVTRGGVRVGLRVLGVSPGSALDRAGVANGDVIVRVAGRPVRDVIEGHAALELAARLDSFVVDLERRGKTVTLVVEREAPLYD